MKWLTHLLAVSTGVAVWFATHPHSPSTGGLASQRGSQSSVAVSPGEKEVLRRLAESREEDRKRLEENRTSLEEIAKSNADYSALDSLSKARQQREWRLKWRSEKVSTARTELDAQLKLARDFENVEDLRIPLREVLMGEADSTAAIAIFLEWHRRDPVAAFDELAVRPNWSGTVLSKDSMMLFLKPEELLAQMEARNRSADFRKKIANGLGSYLLDTDDLVGLSIYYSKLDSVSAGDLLSSFLERQWEPSDPAATLDFVFNRMDESVRKELLSKIAKDYRFSDSSDSSERFESKLVMKYVGEKQFMELVANEEESSRMMSAQEHGSCGGGQDEDQDLTDQQMVEKAVLEKTPYTFDRAIGRLLLHDKDYPELFAAGRISGDEVLHDMMAAIPGSEDHENEARRTVYRELASWNPKAAVHWASGKLADADLQSVSLDFNSYNDGLRALHLLELMEVLPSKFSEGKFHGGLPLALHAALEDWRVLAPEAAEAAMTRSPEALILVERLKVEPEEKSDFSEPQLPPGKEESTTATPEDQ